jgi:hypothetical protein
VVRREEGFVIGLFKLTKIEKRVKNGKMELQPLIYQIQTSNGRGQWLLLYIGDMV